MPWACEVSPQVYALRRLMYCGEYIESHALHIYLLQAPDLLGQPSALDLAAIAPEVVKNALRMKKIGNEILKAIGGRSVHPVNACVGGFYRWPDAAPLKALLPELEWALEAAQAAVKWAVTLPYPELEIDYEFVALHHPEEYGVINGEVWSSKGSHLIRGGVRDPLHRRTRQAFQRPARPHGGRRAPTWSARWRA